MKKLNKLMIKIILIMSLFLLSTSILCKVNAAIVGAPGVGFRDSLVGNFCCQQNTALWSPDIESTYKRWFFSDLPYKQVRETDDLEITDSIVLNLLNKMANNGLELEDEKVSSEEYEKLKYSVFKMIDNGELTSRKTAYRVGDTKIIVNVYNWSSTKNAIGAKLDPYTLADSGYGDAAETYIANHSGGYFDGSGQILWWQTAVGQSRKGGTSNVNDATVNQWENYIRRATGESNPKCSEDGFDITYNPKWVTGKKGNDDYDNPKAVFEANTQKYIIGPFAINYIYGGEFAHITGFRVYTDASDMPIDSNSVKIVACDDIKNDNIPAPAPNTTFYLQIDVIPNATKITNIEFDFKYDNGYVFYERYDSPNGYEICEISADLYQFISNYYYLHRQNVNGTEITWYNNSPDKVVINNYVSLHKVRTISEDAQSLAEVGISGSATGGGAQDWWTREKTLDRKSSSHKATISIEKIIKGVNGETLSLADLGLDENSSPSFDFEINVAGNSKEIISIKPGETKTSKVYEWKGDTAPSFTVKECDNSAAIEKLNALGYEIGDISLKNATSTGGGAYDASKKEFSGQLPSEGNLITLNNDQIPSTTIHLNATNTKKPDSGGLKIVKKFEDYNISLADSNQTLLNELNSKIEELKNTKYNFDVEIIGNFEYKDENNNWVKCTTANEGYKRTVGVSFNEPWNSPEIRWYGEQPRYTVKEQADSTGVTKVKSMTPNNGSSQMQSEGQLAKGQTVTVTALNELNVEKANIQIIKKVNFKGYIPLDSNDSNKENLKRIYAEEVRKHIFKFELNVENYYGYESGNPSMKIDVPGTLGVWEEEGENIYFVITKTIEQEFIWAKGNNGLKYELIEKDDDKTTFTDATSNGMEITVTKEGKKVEGKLKPSGSDLVAEIQNTFINSVIDPEYDIKAINLYKMISNQEELKGKDYNFRVILRGKAFKYGDITYATDNPEKDIIIQLTNTPGDEYEVKNEQYSDTKVVTIKINQNELINNWTSEKISWCTFVDAPTYTIEELTQGTNLEDSIINGENRLDTALGKKKMIEKLELMITGLGEPKENSTDAIYKSLLVKIKNQIENDDYAEGRSLFIIAKNIYDIPELKTKEGKIGIVKILKDQGLLSDDDIKKLEFSFDIQIGNNVPYNIKLKYDEDENKNCLYKINNEYYWIYTSDKITWMEGEPTPKYSVEEKDGNSSEYGIVFDSIDSITKNTINSNSDHIITGDVSTELIYNEEEKAKENYLEFITEENKRNIIKNLIEENKIRDITDLITVSNKIDTNNGKNEGTLSIRKDVTNGSLINKDFNFKVTISGKYIYAGPDGDENIDGKKEFEINVKGGQKTSLTGIKWYGTAPTYLVEEIDNDYSESEGNRTWTGTFVDKDEGNPEGEIVVIAENGPEDVSGSISLQKTVIGGNVSGNEKYAFKIEIEGKEPYTVTIGPNDNIDLGKFTWDKNQEPPKYKITEINIPAGSKFVSITGTNGTSNDAEHSVSGSLINNENVQVVCTNTIDGGPKENEGKFKVEKKVAQNPKGGVDLTKKTFTIKMLISGTFTINNENIVNGTYEITKEVNANSVYESPTIKWYGDNKPVVTVSEELDFEGDDKGWRLLGISNNNVQLKPGNSTLITVTNELPEYTVIDLTLELAGKVWEDKNTDVKGKESNANGLYDGGIKDGIYFGEDLIQGVEVYVYKNYKNGKRELATIYDNFEGAVITQPIITDKTGHWDAPRVKISDEGYLKDYSFDVEFVYDGQTYEPTKFLALTNNSISKLKNGATGNRLNQLNNYNSTTTNSQKASIYKNSTTGKRDYYQFSSMALDADRNEVNNRIAEVKGYTAIDGNGNTTGIVVSNTGKENYVYYKAKNVGTNNSRVISEIQTLNSDKTALDLFKAKARTSVGNLTYAFDNQMVISTVDRKITGQGLQTTINAKATYNYCLNINLGLTKRQEADVEAQKDLVSADVIVKDKRMTYNFNKLSDKINDISQGIVKRTGIEGLDAQNITYTLGLYKTDYYYRAEMYKASENYEAINNFYNKIYPNEGIDATNIEIYLNYKITIYNGSSSKYLAKINSVEDYYENSLELVTTKVDKYIKNKNGTEKDGAEKEEIVRSGPRLFNKSGNFTYDREISYNVVETNIKSSDGITYNKLKFDLPNGENVIKSGQKLEIYLTLKAEADSIEEVKTTLDSYELRNNQKSNIVEISSYSILDKNNNIQGKIDRDSAPSNVDIINRNEKSWYEEDTDEAPRLELGFVENSKTVTGTVWEDNRKDNNYGQYDEGKEALIGGLTTQMVEKVKIQNQENSDLIYTEYDFVWPTNVPLNDLNGRTIEDLTGFSSTVETSRGIHHDDGSVTDVGNYTFTGVPTGNYTVRFLYGNNKLALDNTSKISGDPEALKPDGSRWSNNDQILTANYDNDHVGRTPAVYNGQDYQSTAYKYGESGLIQNEWENSISEEKRLSDARDSEPRRLELIANSETITNVNGEILGSANYKNASHDDLYNMFYMYADTAKLNLNYDNLSENLGTNGSVVNKPKASKYANKNSVQVDVNHTDYNVTRIDFGLVERPENTTILDKEISEIKIITNDGKTIFDGIYHTNYKVVNEGDRENYLVKLAKIDNNYLVAETVLDKDNSIGIDVLQALNKKETKWGEPPINEGTQNFRYINIEERILQGTTIEIKYNMYALNASENDYTSTILDEIDLDKEHKKDGSDIEQGNTDYRIRTSSEIKGKLLELAKESYENSYTSRNKEAIISDDTYKIGSYLGEYYYRHTPNDKDKIVTTKVRQVVDYIDNNGEFKSDNNSTIDNSWKKTTMTELNGNGIKADRLLRNDILAFYEILDKYGIRYINEDNSNIVLSIDSQNNTTGSLNNNGFEKELVPYSYSDNFEHYSSMIGLTVNKAVSAEDDADNLTYDNLAEIVKYENSVGRRNVTAVPGNSTPILGEFIGGIKEIDSSATELITFMPPTGIEVEDTMQNQVIIAVLAGITLIAGGIIVIKKKILK